MTETSSTVHSTAMPTQAGAGHLRIAVVSDSTPERNGVGSYYSDLVEQLSGRIARAELICPEGGHSRWQRYLVPPLPGDRTQKIWLPRPFKLWIRVSSLDPHAIVVPTPGPFGLAGLLAAKRLRVPLIVGFHTHYEALTDIYWTHAFGRFCRRYLTWCNRLLFRNSSLVLANSPEMRRQAALMGAEGTELMGTSVATEFLTRPLRLPRREVSRILFAGRLADEKNVPKVIEVARARPNLRVSIAGDGPMKQLVVDATKEIPNLNYLGWVSRSELIDSMDDHDALLLPSQVESFGTVALEGMARGRLVIVSTACGISEWPELENGLFHIGGDETAAQAVDRVIALPAAYRQEKARIAREAAVRLNEWNLSSWIQRLRNNSNHETQNC